MEDLCSKRKVKCTHFKPKFNLQVKAKGTKADPKRVAALEKVLNAKDADLEAAVEKARTVEEKVNEVHEEIMKITGGKLKGLKKKVDEINKKLKNVTAEITRLQVIFSLFSFWAGDLVSEWGPAVYNGTVYIPKCLNKQQ